MYNFSVRIARALALAGIASRRKCETHVAAGEVAVNGEIIRDLGRQVEPARDRLTFHGKPLSFQQHIYYLLHKPAGYVTTVSDPHADKTVYELLPSHLRGDSPLRGQSPTRIFPVGRVELGPLKLGNLLPGKGRLLTPSEVEMLKRACYP